MLTRQRGYELAEVAVSWEDRPGTKVSLLRDGIGSLIGLFRIRWNAAQGIYSSPRSLETSIEEWRRGEKVSGPGSTPPQEKSG